jgi:phosphoenolpyruvate---glycerone phosphotransferase subunit DhaL
MAEEIAAGQVADWIRTYAGAIEREKDNLTALDAAIGDADHGINMDRGMKAALERLEGTPDGDAGGIAKAVAMALISKVGGAAGPLYGTFFLQLGTAAGGKATLSPGEWADALEAGIGGVQTRGKAEPGDKTMLDALRPALDELRAALGEGAALPDALRRSASAARHGAEATVPLIARKGRASYLGERSRGHQDPGATSSALLLESAAQAFA